jgi:N-acetylglucosaminyldiphosphoundecaprenol N-acetyl-beta-D-mannosaminyltransferase
VNVLGSPIDRVDMDQAVAVCEDAVQSRRLVQHIAINAAKLVALRSDADLLRIAGSCELITADGQSVVWASRLLGEPLPCRVAGIDLMLRLFGLGEERGYKAYILGAEASVLDRAIRQIRSSHPGLQIVGYRHGFFTSDEEPSVVAEIAAASPDMLFVAMSSPRKERFLGRYREELSTPLIMGVGGAIDVVAGVTRRAPESMQRLGLEWLFRLLQEPRRLFRRYLMTNARFMALVLRALLRRPLESPRRFARRLARPENAGT